MSSKSQKPADNKAASPPVGDTGERSAPPADNQGPPTPGADIVANSVDVRTGSNDPIPVVEAKTALVTGQTTENGSTVVEPPVGGGRPAETITPIVDIASSGEVHPSLTGTVHSTELHRPDDPTLEAFRASHPQRTVVTGASQAEQTRLAGLIGAPNPLLPNDPNPPTVPPRVRGLELSSSEMDLLEEKPKLAFINGQPVPREEELLLAAGNLQIGTITDELISGMVNAGEAYATGLGKRAGDVVKELATFTEQLRPQLESLTAMALAGNRPARRELGFLRDAIASRTGKVTEGMSDEARLGFNSLMTSVISGGLRVAIGLARLVARV